MIMSYYLPVGGEGIHEMASRDNASPAIGIHHLTVTPTNTSKEEETPGTTGE